MGTAGTSRLLTGSGCRALRAASRGGAGRKALNGLTVDETLRVQA